VAEEHERLGERGEDPGPQLDPVPRRDRRGPTMLASARSWSPRVRETRPSIS
jgi:hypothetical protein